MAFNQCIIIYVYLIGGWALLSNPALHSNFLQWSLTQVVARLKVRVHMSSSGLQAEQVAG